MKGDNEVKKVDKIKNRQLLKMTIWCGGGGGLGAVRMKAIN